jgi:hypothetical protein
VYTFSFFCFFFEQLAVSQNQVLSFGVDYIHSMSDILFSAGRRIATNSGIWAWARTTARIGEHLFSFLS